MENHTVNQFCGSKFWDIDLSWNTKDPDLTECFQKTVLIWAPCIILWMFSPLEAYYLRNSKQRNIPCTWLFILKLLLTVTLITLTIIDLGKSIRDNYLNIKVYNVNYVTPSVKIVSFSLVIVLLFYNRKYGMRTSGLLWTFWMLLSLCGTVEFRSLLKKNHNEIDSKYEFISYMIYFPIVVLLFLLNFLVDAKPQLSEYPLIENPCPEKNASSPSRLILGWLDSLIWRGFKHPLEASDLWSLSNDETTNATVSQFDKYWYKSLKKIDTIQNSATARNSSNHVDSNNDRKKKIASILPPLCKAFGSIFISSVILRLTEVVVIFISPEILKLLIDFTSHPDEPMWRGHLYAALLFVTAIIKTLVSNHCFYRTFLFGLRMRTALMGAIYRKVLRMSNSSRKKSTVGEIVNLMLVDAQKFLDVAVDVNYTWSAPLQIGLALYFLWKILGLAVLSGLAVLISLIPLNAVIAHKLRKRNIGQMKKKDERVKMMNEILSGIKVLKLYAWECSFEEKILKIRNEEMKLLKEIAYFYVASNFLWSCAPFLVSLVSFATFLLIDEKNVLDTSTAFVSLSLFNILRFPLAILPGLINNLVQTSVSVKRINNFMNSAELDPNNVQQDQSEVNPLIIENGNFSWDLEDTEKLTLRNINLQIKQGQLVAIVGTVGSGKSSIISALLGEMEKLSGRVNVKGSIVYVSQQAWIQNTTLQNNILFGKPLNESLYNRVIEACALVPDLKILPAGDQTEIGENGINLSGGQKQRVSLARAIYNDSDIYFFDDPLSAVDSHVGKHIFDKLIGPRGLIKNKTRLLVTHGLTYLPEVDNIIVLKDGEINESGTYEELIKRRGAFAEFITHLQEMKSENKNTEDSVKTKHRRDSTIINDESQSRANYEERLSNSGSISESESITSERPLIGPKQRQHSVSSHHSDISLQNNNAKDQNSHVIGEKLIETENAETGSVKWTVYFYYMKSFGWFLAASTIFMNVIFQGIDVGSNVWLSYWSSDNETVVNGTANTSKRDMYLGVYGAFGLAHALSLSLCVLAPLLGCWYAGRRMHINMLHRIMRAPMTFFDTTPTGRIISRFAKDVDALDTILPGQIYSCIYCVTEVIAILIVISYSTPLVVTVLLPLAIIYYFIQHFYISTSRQLKRIESVSRSPIYSHFGESITGTQTIRAYGVQERFIEEFESKVDFNQICCYPSNISRRWLTIRLDVLGSIIIFFAALFAVLGRDTINPGIVALSISYALQITLSLSWLVRMTSEVETNIVAVERIQEYSEISQEASWDVPNNDPPKEWPMQGSIDFQVYRVRYREGLNLVLNGLTFNVKGGEKVGIVGRTGAGKSSLTLALFRIIEAADGKIFIDNVDISKLGLHTLRSRLTIIPQDPVLFSGSLRFNLDPFNKCSDCDIWKALDHAHLKEFIESLPNGLIHEVTEGGSNLSVGQRQLICLARALLRKTKVLILDEATAAIDLQTDDFIQKTIREQFNDCTILTIAHRLNTILDSDRIIVLDNGSIVEFDAPNILLKKPDSSFYSMAKDAGLVL